MLILITAVAAAVQGASAVPAKQGDDPVICTRQHVGEEVGTRMQAKKVCMRKSDRDFIENSQKATIQNYINDGDGRMRAPVKPR